MALNAGTVWEIRTTGSQANGGGFYDRDPGTSVDYSQQDAAQLTVTDLATDGAGTGLSSATGGFTAAMVGNIIRISGGTLTAGWYEITARADTNNVTIDRSAGLGKTGGTGNVGGAFLLGGALDDDFLSANVVDDGHTVWIKTGTYTLGEAVTTSAASAALPVRIIGYKTARGDNPTGDDRPLIDAGSSYYYAPDNYWNTYNIRFTGSALRVVWISGDYCTFVNCKATNTSGTADRDAFTVNCSSPTMFVKCEAVSTNGRAFHDYAGQARYYMCYAHDSNMGFTGAVADGVICDCVADTCATHGISAIAGWVITGNTVYNCATGISLTATALKLVVNNIVTGCTTGIAAATAAYDRGWLLSHNCLYDNTADYSNITANVNDVTTDPALTNPAAGDFTLGAGSSCFNTGMTLDASVGL
jgi:hypothetical protein